MLLRTERSGPALRRRSLPLNRVASIGIDFAHAKSDRTTKNADPRNEFPNYMLFSLDPAAVVGVSSVVMDVGWQVAAWTDLISVRSDSTILFSSNHPDSDVKL